MITSGELVRMWEGPVTAYLLLYAGTSRKPSFMMADYWVNQN
jgi:hypothetical protein